MNFIGMAGCLRGWSELFVLPPGTGNECRDRQDTVMIGLVRWGTKKKKVLLHCFTDNADRQHFKFQCQRFAGCRIGWNLDACRLVLQMDFLIRSFLFY
jgi:hypothetical protein